MGKHLGGHMGIDVSVARGTVVLGSVTSPAGQIPRMPDHKGCFQEGLTLTVSPLFPWSSMKLRSLSSHAAAEEIPKEHTGNV